MKDKDIKNLEKKILIMTNEEEFITGLSDKYIEPNISKKKVKRKVIKRKKAI